MNRRNYLAASAVAVASAVAGCQGSDIIGDGDGSASGGGVEALDTEGILELMHPPGEFEDGDHYSFSLSAPAMVDTIQGDVDDEIFNNLVTRARNTGVDAIDALGVDFWEVGTQYSAGPVTVLVGSFERRNIGRRLQYEGLDYQGDYDGFALIEQPGGDGDTTIAIEGEGRINDETESGPISRIYIGESVDGADSTTVVQTLIDVAGGVESRYSDSVESVEPLVESLSGAALIQGETYEPVEPDGQPTADLEYEQIPIGETVTGTLTSDTTAYVENEFPYLDRYGFAGQEDAAVEINVEPDDPGQGSIEAILHAGNTDENIAQGSSITAQLPEDGAYNFIVYDPQQVTNPRDTPRDYTVEVTLESAVGGPETGVFEGETARGRSLRFEDDMAVVRSVIVFDGEPSMDDIDVWIDENDADGEFFGAFEDVSSRQDGAKAIVEGTISLSELLETTVL